MKSFSSNFVRSSFLIFVSLFLIASSASAQTPTTKTPPTPPAFLKDIKSEADFKKLTPEQQKEATIFLRSITPPSLVGPSTEAPKDSVSCFDYYRFGSVQVDLSATLLQTIPGVPMTFTGKLKNDNNYPVVDGSVYVKIFRKGGDQSLIQQNGYPLIDQFALPGTYVIPAKGEREASFTWKVPENAKSGEYMAAFFFQTAKRYNLLGLSFTDDVTGNQAHFSVTTKNKNLVEFNKNTVTLNSKAHHFAAFPLHFTKDETVVAKVTLTNPNNTPIVIPVTWKLYAWDSLREETLNDTKTELVSLKANEAKELSYGAKPINASVSYLVVEAKDGNSKSILDIRFVRDGIEETRINFPSITKYPLTQNEENTLFSCVHSTNQPVVKNNILTLTLKDEKDNIIHSYKYQGDITGAMMGIKEAFTPKKTYVTFSLTATLERNGKIIEEVTQKYDCKDINPGLCPKEGTGTSGGSGKGAMLLIALALIASIGTIGLKIWKNKETANTMKTLSFFFAILLSGAFLLGGAKGVEAKSTVWNMGAIPFLAYYGDCGGSCTGWWWKGLVGATGSITYNAQVKNADTGSIVPDGSPVPVGTHLKFENLPHLDTDISWNGTGYSLDTPYGTWLSGASAPLNPLLYYVNTAATFFFPVFVYIPLSVNPPTASVQPSTSNLSCDSFGVCTVTASGPVSASVVFGATYGKFYYKYTGGPYDYYNKVAMRPCSSFVMLGVCGGWGSSDYILSVPTQSISFALTASAATTKPPTAPTITPQPFSGNINTAYPFSFTATDPDAFDTIRYGIDWNNDNIVDQYAPSTGFVASGVSQTASNPSSLWSTPGTYSFKVRTEDNQGGVSGWTTATVTTTTGLATCVNGATNPPTCNVCSAGQSFAFGACYPNCTNGALNPPICNVCSAGQTFVSGSCVASCSNGASNPPTCNTCPSSQTLISGVCTIPGAVCGDGICTPPGETLLTCPKDCKGKVQQF